MGWDGRLTHREKYAQNSTRPFKGGLAGRPTFGTHQKLKKKIKKYLKNMKKFHHPGDQLHPTLTS